MAACRSAIERKTPRRMRWRVILEKKFSTAFSQEAEVGVKWKVQHRVDRLLGRDLAFDGVEKADELHVAVALHAAPDDGSVEHAERREPGRRPMALVVVG